MTHRVMVVGAWPVLDSERARIENQSPIDDVFSARGWQIVQLAASSPALLMRMRVLQPDWLLVAKVGFEQGLDEAVAKWRLTVPGARLAMLGSHRNRRRGEAWLRRGCTVYLDENSPADRVLGSLDASSDLDLIIFDYSLFLRWRHSIPEIPEFTNRQRQVLQLVMTGFTNSEIAAKLYLTEHTVEFHIRHILRKLEARNRTEATERAHNLGIF